LKRSVIGYAVALTAIVSGCGSIVGPTAQEMTLIAQNQDLTTQIAQVRQTATHEFDNLQITAEFAAILVRRNALERDALRATLIARGTDPGFIDVTLPQGIAPDVVIPNTTGATVPIAPAVTPPGGVNTPIPLITATATATPPASGTRLTEVVMASGVDNNDCALDSVSSYAATAERIYVVGRALEFPAGTQIRAVWSYEGQQRGAYDISFDFAIDNACIWAFIDQSEFEFTPGNWTVQLAVNGVTTNPPLAFTVIAQPAADPMTQGTATAGGG